MKCLTNLIAEEKVEGEIFSEADVLSLLKLVESPANFLRSSKIPRNLNQFLSRISPCPRVTFSWFNTAEVMQIVL